jgi:hypothetical protein
MLLQRDQFSHAQLKVSDQTLIQAQHDQRETNHQYSERSKANGASPAAPQNLLVGDLVFLKADRSKNHARERYIVSSIDGDWCHIMKFNGPKLRSKSYKIQLTECEIIPALCNRPMQTLQPVDSNPEIPNAEPTPPPPPDVPELLSRPADQPTPSPDIEDKLSSNHKPSRNTRPPAWQKDYVMS